MYASGEAKPKFSFPFFVGSPHTPAEEKEMQGKFLVFAPATAGSGRGAHHWSSGFNSKYIRTLFNTHRKNSESKETDKAGSRRRRDPVFAPETLFEKLRRVRDSNSRRELPLTRFLPHKAERAGFEPAVPFLVHSLSRTAV